MPSHEVEFSAQNSRRNVNQIGLIKGPRTTEVKSLKIIKFDFLQKSSAALTWRYLKRIIKKYIQDYIECR
jgi:hypothetical protein